MLANAGDIHRLGTGQLTNALNGILRGEQAVARRRVPERVALLQQVQALPPRRQIGELCAGLQSRYGCDEIADHLGGVADDRHIGGTDLADLGGIDIGVDHLRIGCEQRGLACHAVVKARTDRDEQVALLQREHRRHRAVHAGHAEVLRVRVWKDAARHQGGDYGSSDELGELQQLGRGAGATDTAADVEDGALGRRDQLGCGLNLLAVCLGDRAVADEVDSCIPYEIELGLLRIFGDVDEHGAGAAGARNLVGRGDRARNVFGPLHQERMLRDRHGDADDVDLLERVGAHQVREHLAGDRKQRHRVHVCVGDGGDEVGRTGA